MRHMDAALETKGSRPQAMVLTALGLVVLVVTLAGQVLGWWDLDLGGPDDLFTSILPALFFIVLGAVILSRSNSDRIGWLFGAMGLSIMLSGLAQGLAEFGYLTFAGVAGAFWLGWIMAVGLLIIWFPTGRVLTPRWLWVQWSLMALIATTFLLYAFAEEVCVDSGENGCVEWAANPVGVEGVPDPEFGWIAGPAFLAVVIVLLSAITSLVVRIIRSRGAERQQLKWFLLAAGLFVLGMGLSAASENLGHRTPPWWVDLILTAGIISLPVSVTIAVLRYRLYDIDRIISRTVSYGLVIGCLAAGVALVAAVVGTRFESPVVVAGTTLGIAAAFNPLRRRAQKLVDCRFNRSRFDAERIMVEFTGTLRHRVDVDEILAGWRSVVGETMQPSRAGIWVRE